MSTENRFFRIFSFGKLRRRVLVAFLIIMVLVLVTAVASYLQLRQIQPYSEQIIQNSSDLVLLQDLASATASLDANLERYLVIRGVEYRDNVNEDLQNIQDVITLLQNVSSSGMESELTDIETTASQLTIEVQNVLDAISADASSGQITRAIVSVYELIDQLLLQQQELSAQTLDNLQTTAQTQSRIARNVLIQAVILSVFVVAITFTSILFVDRRLRAIITLTNTTAAMADGDLTHTAPVEGNDEISQLAISFNTMTSQLRGTLENLESQVASRTQALEISSEVSRRLSTIIDQNQLVREVVDQLQTAFGYYHAHIYLVDEKTGDLVMAGGTGEAGRTMLARGHRIEKGRGLVGRAAQSNETVLIRNVANAVGWLPNPLLPDTKAEVAVPIAIGPNVLGVLDVQHNVVDGLSQEDADLILAIANQVAIALQNAQAYERVQSQADRETKITTISQRIQNAATVEDVLKVAVSELSEVLEAQHSSVELRVADKGNGRE